MNQNQSQPRSDPQEQDKAKTAPPAQEPVRKSEDTERQGSPEKKQDSPQKSL